MDVTSELLDKMRAQAGPPPIAVPSAAERVAISRSCTPPPDTVNLDPSAEAN